MATVDGEVDRLAPGAPAPAGRALAGAVLGWLALVAFVYAASPFFGIRPGSIAGFLGSLVTGRTGPATEWVGRGVLLAVALAWGALYRFVRPSLPGPEWARGLVYGLGLWLVSGAVLLPVLGVLHPVAGAGGVERPGLLGFGFGGLPGVLMSILAHAVFGLVLGLFTAARLRA